MCNANLCASVKDMFTVKDHHCDTDLLSTVNSARFYCKCNHANSAILCYNQLAFMTYLLHKSHARNSSSPHNATLRNRDQPSCHSNGSYHGNSRRGRYRWQDHSQYRGRREWWTLLAHSCTGNYWCYCKRQNDTLNQQWTPENWITSNVKLIIDTCNNRYLQIKDEGLISRILINLPTYNKSTGQ